jgi:hypothetical protein
MEQPCSVLGPEMHRSPARPAAAVGPTRWDRHRFDLDQAKSRETPCGTAIRLGALKQARTAQIPVIHRQISEPKVLRCSPVKPRLPRPSSHRSKGRSAQSYLQRQVDLRRRLSRAMSQDFARRGPARQHIIHSGLFSLESDMK